MLQIDGIETGYGRKQVLFGLSLEVHQGETVAVIGPNGSGKSTLLKVICGLIQPWKGQIRFAGDLLNGSTPAANVGRGITFAPQGNRVFADLSVLENLEIGGCHVARKELRARIEQVMDMFPILRQRHRQAAGRLSGGEQQMLALARALIPKPRLLMLDEPSLGLSPGIVKQVFERIQTISRESGTSILIVEQKVREVLAFCKRVYSLRLGRIAFEGPPGELIADKSRLKDLFL